MTDTPIDDWYEQLERQVATTPPSCLQGFKCSPAHAQVNDNHVGWSLACRCGSKSGEVLGHPLAGLNPDYDGPLLYVSPLFFRCTACRAETEIIDTKQHGYNSEISKLEGDAKSCDSNYRGSGEPDVIHCQHCRSKDFEITAFCMHSHFDLIEDEPELEPRTQDFFDGFELRGDCTSCCKISSFSGFELA